LRITPWRSRFLTRLRSPKSDPPSALDRNDAYNFFKPLGDLVVPGPTFTNGASSPGQDSVLRFGRRQAGRVQRRPGQGYSVVLIFIGISGPERSDERVEQGQVTMEAEVMVRDHRLRPQQTSSFRPLPQEQGRLRWGSPPPPVHCTSRCAPAGVTSAARKRVY